MPANATCTGKAGSRSAAANRRAPSASPAESPAGRVQVAGDVSVAVTSTPSWRVETGTMPTFVSSVRTPAPYLSAMATADATVAWPQKSTSARGLKYRTLSRAGSDSEVGLRKAVSE